jgi:hypothetical protein
MPIPGRKTVAVKAMKAPKAARDAYIVNFFCSSVSWSMLSPHLHRSRDQLVQGEHP